MNNNPNYYAVLTADVRYDKQLSPQEKILYAEITALSNKEGVCFAGNKYFADLYSLTETTISHQLSHLVDAGYIVMAYDKEGSKVKKRFITVVKNRNGEGVLLAKKSNGTVAKNRKDNNTSNIINLNNNNEARECTELFCKCIEKNGLKPRGEQVKATYAKVFDTLFGAYSVDEVKRMIVYATSDNFWKKICLSAASISKHAERLYVGSLTMKDGQLDCDRVTDTKVDF